jgi:hypothetical protein
MVDWHVLALTFAVLLAAFLAVCWAGYQYGRWRRRRAG